jgi:hypothetical protein
MKMLFVLFGLLLGVFSVFAFSLGGPRNDPRTLPPEPAPLLQADAYSLATQEIGSATNSFLCIWTNGNLSWGTGYGSLSTNGTFTWTNWGDWLFVFADTNKHTKTVYVSRKLPQGESDTNDVVIWVFDDLARE